MAARKPNILIAAQPPIAPTREYFDRSAKQATTLLLRNRLRFSRLAREQGYPAPFALALACFGCTEPEFAEFRTRYPALVVSPHS